MCKNTQNPLMYYSQLASTCFVFAFSCFVRMSGCNVKSGAKYSRYSTNTHIIHIVTKSIQKSSKKFFNRHYAEILWSFSNRLKTELFLASYIT